MKTNFTKGPWFIDQGEQVFPNTYPIVDGGVTVAHVETWNEESKEVQEQARANADAITAVPDLVKAIQGLLKGHRKWFLRAGIFAAPSMANLDWNKRSEVRLAKRALEKAGVKLK